MAEAAPIHHEVERLRSVIPEELQAYDHFVYWKLIESHGRLTKLPFSPVTGELASSIENATWGTFDEALEAYTTAKANGIGFVFSPDDPFVGIDLDHVIVNGVIEPKARQIVQDLHSYTEISQSGQGLHVIAQGHIPHGRRTTGIEMYSQARYFALTGIHLVGTPKAILDAKDKVESLYTSIAPQASSTPLKMAQNEIYKLSEDDEVLAKATGAKNGSRFTELWQGKIDGYASKSNADWQLVLMLLYWTNDNVEQTARLFRQSGLYDDKTDSMRGNTTYLDYTIQSALQKRIRR